MESKDELKEIDIKIHTCYYFDDIMVARDISLDKNINILLDKKICENILIYDVSYKTVMGSKPLHIWFDGIDGFMKIYDGIRYLVLLGHNWFDEIFDSVKYLITSYKWKSGITNSINHNFSRIRIDSYNYLPIEKILTFYNVIILINSVVNKNKNYYYLNICLEKGSYNDKSNTNYF